jgi:hypothetical protein
MADDIATVLSWMYNPICCHVINGMVYYRLVELCLLEDRLGLDGTSVRENRDPEETFGRA